MSSDLGSILASASFFIVARYSFPYTDETDGLKGCLSVLCDDFVVKSLICVPSIKGRGTMGSGWVEGLGCWKGVGLWGTGKGSGT